MGKIAEADNENRINLRSGSDSPPRIGVYVCHCGLNIDGSLDCEEVAQFAANLDDVVLARHQEKWIRGEVLYIPRLNRFYVQHDPLGSSTLTYYGPFEGEPWERLGIPEPEGSSK